MRVAAHSDTEQIDSKLIWLGVVGDEILSDFGWNLALIWSDCEPTIFIIKISS